MEKNASSSAGKKGKGRATAPATTMEESFQDRSIASRVAASAAGLTRDLIRGTGDASTVIATGSALSGKSQGALAASSTPAADLSQTAAESSRNAPSTSNWEAGLNESFRSNVDPSPRLAAEFDQFSSAAPPLETLNSRPRANVEVATHLQTEEVVTSDAPDVFTSFQVDDGADVRMLLSNPNFSTESPPTSEPIDMPDQSADDYFGANYSTKEQAAIQKIKSNLPPPPTHQAIPTNHPLNLNPESLLKNDQDSIYDTRSQVSTPTIEQREKLLSEWEAVLNSYTDEVWGEQLPVVQAAREQIQEVREGTRSLDSKAVARLKQILGHVKESAPSYSSLSSSLSHATVTRNHLPANHQIDRPHRQQQQQHQQPQPQRRRRREDKPAEKKRRRLSVFHCPWISCHEHFYDVLELRLHSTTHTFFTCPHIGCSEHFGLTEEWDEHLQVAHHDLLDTRMNRPQEIEA